MPICTVKTMLEKSKRLTICNRRVAAFWGPFPPASHLIFSPVIYLSQRCTNSGICIHRWNKEFTLEQPIEIEPITLISLIAKTLGHQLPINCFKRSVLRIVSKDLAYEDRLIWLHKHMILPVTKRSTWFYHKTIVLHRAFFSDQYM